MIPHGGWLNAGSDRMHATRTSEKSPDPTLRCILLCISTNGAQNTMTLDHDASKLHWKSGQLIEHKVCINTLTFTFIVFYDGQCTDVLLWQTRSSLHISHALLHCTLQVGVVARELGRARPGGEASQKRDRPSPRADFEIRFAENENALN